MGLVLPARNHNIKEFFSLSRNRLAQLMRRREDDHTNRLAPPNTSSSATPKSEPLYHLYRLAETGRSPDVVHV